MPHVEFIEAAPESPLSFPARVRMRDGILLAADVYLPGAPDRSVVVTSRPR